MCQISVINFMLPSAAQLPDAINNGETMRRLFKVWLLLLVCFSQGALAKDLLTPEQVTDLTLQAFVNCNEDSVKKLDEYLRPLYPNDEDVSYTRIFILMPSELKDLAAFAIQRRLPPKDRQQIQPDAEKFAAALVAAQRRAQCHATGHKIRMHEGIENQRLATVYFECTIADVNTARLHLKEFSGKPWSVRSLQTFLQKYTEILENGQTRTLNGEFDLYEREQRWTNEASTNISSVVLNALWIDTGNESDTGQ